MTDLEETLEGSVERVVYQNDRFRIVKLFTDAKERLSVLGEFPSVSEGARVRVTGRRSRDERYGDQIKAVSVLEISPNTLAGLTAYLAGGTFEGVGKVTAERIVKAFGEKTMQVLNDSPELLCEVKGVSQKVAEGLGKQWRSKREVHDLMVFLRQCGVGEALAESIHDLYTKDAMTVVRKTPYRLCAEVKGVGFLTADKIAREVGIEEESIERMKASIRYSITMAEEEAGHTCFTASMLYFRVLKTLGGDMEVNRRPLFDEALEDLVKVGGLTKDTFGKDDVYYRTYTFNAEKALADKAYDLGTTPPSELCLFTSCDAFEKESKVTLGELQRDAVRAAAECSMMVITGGPGTGKTTILKAILSVFKEAGLVSALASPTGRAAKRMQEATGQPAQTLHRLLKYSMQAQAFRCDAANPIACPCKLADLEEERRDSARCPTCRGSGLTNNGEEECYRCEGMGGLIPYDAVIVDEASMLDLSLANALFDAVPSGSRLILVGDVDQLPSVGPGCVLRDIIHSDLCTVMRLKHIYRQAEGSLIVDNAHGILKGKMPVSDPARDFVALANHTGVGARNKVVALVPRVLEKYKLSPKDVQVMSPQHKGDAGVIELNRALQEAMNPKSPCGATSAEGPAGLASTESNPNEFVPPQVEDMEHFAKGMTFRVGDRVMQTKNNYDKGVFNGEVGYITESTKTGIVVTFDDKPPRVVYYEVGEMDMLQLAYASTIHKSQGSEYPVVIVVLLSSHGWMLTRNLVYTAITRGKRLVVVVTDAESMAVRIALTRRGSERFTRLAERIARISGATITTQAVAPDESGDDELPF